MNPDEPTTHRQPVSKWRTIRRRIGAVLLSLAYVTSLLGLLTVATVGSALMVLGLLILGPALTLHSTRRRLMLSIPSLALGVLGLIIIVEANV